MEETNKVIGTCSRTCDENWMNKCMDIDFPGWHRRGRLKKTWHKVVRGDLRVKSIQCDLAQNKVISTDSCLCGQRTLQCV